MVKQMPVTADSKLALEFYETGMLAFDQIKFGLAYHNLELAILSTGQSGSPTVKKRGKSPKMSLLTRDGRKDGSAETLPNLNPNPGAHLTRKNFYSEPKRKSKRSIG